MGNLNKWRRTGAFIMALMIGFLTLPIGGVQAYAAPKDYETIVFGQNNQRSSHYYLKNNEVILTIVSMTGNASFRTSLVDGTSGGALRYITTTSYGDAWFTNASGDTAAPIWTEGTISDDVMPGHVYEAHYVRNGNDYKITYTDYTEGELLYEYTATGTNLKATAIYAYVNALAGSFQIYQGSPEDFGFQQGEPAVEVEATHGTVRDRFVTKEELDQEIPSKYTINEKTQGDAKDGAYNEYFLKDDLQTIEVTIDENNLNYMLQNASSKETVMAESVSIGGEKIGYVGFKTKGNFTRSHTLDTDSDRFSFAINFGKYINKESGYEARQNFYGLSKVSFNNFYFDKTMMKEYNALRLMSEMGLPTPQYGLAKIYINGEYYGVYSMIESYDSSILKQYYGVSGKELAKFMMKPSYYHPRYYAADLDLFRNDEGEFTMESMVAGGAIIENADGSYSPGAALSGYGGLWESDTDNFQKVAREIPNVMNWMYRLTALSNGRDFEGNEIDVNSDEYVELLAQVMDIDEALRYFAAHSFLCQMDNMFTWKQNYGLYINPQGSSILIPWDYDLAWGCDGNPATGEDVANYNVDMLYNDIAAGSNYYSDDPKEFYGGDAEVDYMGNTGYPLFNVIYQNDSLMEKYHNYMEDCSKLTALGGTTTDGDTYDAGRYATTIREMYDKVVDAAGEKLADHVYYLNYSQPDAAKRGLLSLKQIIALRAVGVYLQVNGIDAKVTGYGYDQGCLGNDADRGNVTTQGEQIAAVDGDSGIFAIADYGTSSGGPKITAGLLDSGDETYQEIKKQLSAKKDTLAVYEIESEKKPTSDYKLYIPVSKAYAEAGAVIYSFDKKTNTLQELSAEVVDNMYVVSTSDISCIAIYSADAKNVTVPAGAAQSEVLSKSMILWMIIAGAAVLLAAAGVLVYRKTRK